MSELPDRSAPPRMADYEREYASFRLEVPEVFNPTVDIVEAWAGREPEALALVSLDGAGGVVAEQSVADLARESRRCARALAAAGIGKGDRVFVMLPRVPAWYAAVLGAIRIGAVVAPAPNMLTPRDIGYRVGTLGAAAAIVDSGGAERLDAAPEGTDSLRVKIAWDPERVAGAAAGGEAPAAAVGTSAAEVAGPPPGWEDFDALLDAAGDGDTPAEPTRREDPILIFFTSGTVSYPKMVQQSAAYGLGHVPTARFWHDLRPGDRHWTVSDTGWAKAAWGGLFGQWHEGATVVQVALGKPDADTILGIIAGRQGHLLLRPADPLPPAGPGRPRRPRPLRPAPLHQRRRAAQPGGDPGLGGGRRAHRLRRLRPVGDDADGRQLPLPAGAAGVDGQAGAGLGRRRLRRGGRARPRRHGGQRRRAASRAAARSGSSTNTSATTRRTPRRSATATTTPATRPGATAMATSGSRAATTT